MLKATLFTGQSLCYKSFSLSTSIPRTIVLKAFFSTNTAILRGIRKSNPGAKSNKSKEKPSWERRGSTAKSRTFGAEQKYLTGRSKVESKESGKGEGRFSAGPHSFSAERKYPEARSDFGSKHSGKWGESGDRKGRFSAEPRSFSAERKYPEARSDFGSKHSGKWGESGDRKGRFSAEPRLFSAERKYPEARSDFGSKHSGKWGESGDRKGRFSAEPRSFNAEQKHLEARSDFGSKYSGDKKESRKGKERFSAEPRSFNAERKYPEARSDFGSKYSGDKKESREWKGRFSAEPRSFNAERKYPEARSDFGSKNTGDRKESGGRKGRFPAEPRTISAEQKYPEATSDYGSKHSGKWGESGDRKGRFSPDSRSFSAELKYPEARSDYRSKHSGKRDGGGDRRERFSADRRSFSAEPKYLEAKSGYGSKSSWDRKISGDKESRFSDEPGIFSAKVIYPRANSRKIRSKYSDDSGERNGNFSAEARTSSAEQEYPGTRGVVGFKDSEDSGERKERLSAQPPTISDDPGSKYDDRKWRLSAELRTFAAEQKYSRPKPPKSHQNEEQDVEDIRGPAALKERRSTMTRNSVLVPAADYMTAQDSTRTSVLDDPNLQLLGPQGVFRKLHKPEDVFPGPSTRFDGWKTSEFEPYRRNSPRPVEVPGMKLKSNAPRGIPYTTAASEFLYGTSAVTAALKFSRRKLYKVYIYTGENRSPSSQDGTVRKLALALGIEVINVTGNWLQLLDRMSDGRPHNGYILEASPLPKLPVTGLQRVHGHQRALNVFLDYQSREEEAINGIDQDIQYQPGFPRYPFVLFLDGVVDPGNLGAIVRSAFLFGVDAIAVSKRASAPLSPVALKASAGAAESLPFLSVDKPTDFISESRSNGWKIYAAVLPQGSESWKRVSFTNHSLGRPILDHPCVLMIGGEGEGLAWPLQKKADFTVSVEGARTGQGGVDSLNVSVATAILCDAFLRKVDDPELVSNVIPDRPSAEQVSPMRDVDLGEEKEAGEAVAALEAIDETRAHYDLEEASVSAPKNRLF